MKLFTNCSTCKFIKNDTCSLGKWDSDGFKDKVSKNDEDQFILDRVCPFHRHPDWTGDLDDEIYIRYAVIVSLEDNNNPHKALDSALALFQDSKYTSPEKLYVVDNRSDKSDQADIKKQLDNTGLDYRFKSALVEKDTYLFVDEFVMTGRMDNFFYIFIGDDRFDPEFITGINNLIYSDMQEVLYAGRNNCYFMLAAVHKIYKNGFYQHLSKDYGHAIFDYQQVMEKAKQ